MKTLLLSIEKIIMTWPWYEFVPLDMFWVGIDRHWQSSICVYSMVRNTLAVILKDRHSMVPSNLRIVGSRNMSPWHHDIHLQDYELYVLLFMVSFKSPFSEKLRYAYLITSLWSVLTAYVGKGWPKIYFERYHTVCISSWSCNKIVPSKHGFTNLSCQHRPQ